jgi:hypothetical protein
VVVTRLGRGFGGGNVTEGGGVEGGGGESVLGSGRV